MFYLGDVFCGSKNPYKCSRLKEDSNVFLSSRTNICLFLRFGKGQQSSKHLNIRLFFYMIPARYDDSQHCRKQNITRVSLLWVFFLGKQLPVDIEEKFTKNLTATPNEGRKSKLLYFRKQNSLPKKNDTKQKYNSKTPNKVVQYTPKLAD